MQRDQRSVALALSPSILTSSTVRSKACGAGDAARSECLARSSAAIAAPEKGTGFNEHERSVVIASASSLVDNYVRDGCDHSKCVFTRLGAHRGRAATRVWDEVRAPPGAQHSGSLKAITARQLQALVRRHGRMESARGRIEASPRARRYLPAPARACVRVQVPVAKAFESLATANTR